MKHPLQKCIDAGNDQIILTERGYVFGYNDLIVDPRSFFHMNNFTMMIIIRITYTII